MIRDAVIDVEFQMESVYEPFDFICLRFIDESNLLSYHHS